MEINEDILHRFFAGTASEEQTDEISAWLDENPEQHQRVFDQAYKTYVMQLLCTQQVPERVAPKVRSGFMKPLYRYVASVAAALAIGLGVNYAFFAYRTAQWAEQLTSLEVPAGQHIRLTLSDGSVVDLNAGSKITYPSIFMGKERKVTVSGEAMFDVTHDAEHPFIVETFACNVKVLGTKFNVIAEQAANRFSTALMRGSVLVSSRSNRLEQILMEPNSIVSLENGRLALSQIENPDEYLWPDGIISLSGVPFDQLMTRFEKYYNVRFVYNRTSLPEVAYKRCKVRISEGVEHALDILMLASNFSYTFDKDTNTITIQ